jgi:hypothetical protein
MDDDNPHRAAAKGWSDCAAAGLPPERALQNFEAAFDALWRRANNTLSDVTLMAILDRVLHDAVERFPLLSPLEIEPNGLRCSALRAQAATLDQARLLGALEFVIAAFLTVLGSLVAEILTPALHAELARIAAEQANHPARILSPAKDDEEGNP